PFYINQRSSQGEIIQMESKLSLEYIQPHYKESYRLAIYALVSGGRDAYQEYLKAEQLSDFLSEEEVIFILDNAELPVPEDEDYEAGKRKSEENVIAPSTYFPTESDEEVPDLDLGWPEVTNENVETNISLLFHPPRHNTPTIKETIRKQIQDARQVIAIAMDVFTDVDIFKEIVNATTRGVMVYILLDDFQFKSFLNMAKSAGNLRVRTVKGQQYMCRSGAKFHGSLEQRFLLVDCKTVLYGTYSFMWSFEKINLSMVLVVTGQLVGSYDEEFRRLFARSTLPNSLNRWKIDSYLNNSDATLGEPVDNLHLPDSTQNPNTSSRMRTSVLFNSRLTEQSETPNYMSEHSVTSPQGSLWMLSPQGSLRVTSPQGSLGVTSPQGSLGGLSNFQTQLTPAR
uniref:Scaffolding anchor of CK1 domain-containing protein n=1 Tax=Oncorhynchus mykiss TaxID=8022 RepID=A0A8K9UH27_ONCMY